MRSCLVAAAALEKCELLLIPTSLIVAAAGRGPKKHVLVL